MKRAPADIKTEAALRAQPGEYAEIMTVSALARYLRCNRHTLYKLLKEGKIPALRIGGGWRFRRSNIDRWMANGGGRN
jgi:excisionase family DNA binding protein